MRTLIHPPGCSCGICAGTVPALETRQDLLRRLSGQADIRLTSTLGVQAGRRRARLGRQLKSFGLDEWGLAFNMHLARCLLEMAELSAEDVRHGWAAATQVDLKALGVAMTVWQDQQSDERDLLRRLRRQTLHALVFCLRQEAPGHSLEEALLADDPLALIEQ